MKGNKLKIWSFSALAAIFIITGIGIYDARNISINYNYEDYVTKEDSSVKNYKQFVKNFNADADYLLVGLQNNAGAFDSTFLRKIEQLGNELKTIDDINFLISPCHDCFSYKISGISNFKKVPCISFIEGTKDSLRVFTNKKLIGSIFSSKGKTVTMYISTLKKLNKSSAEALLKNIKNTLTKFDFNEVHVSGRIVTASYYTEKLGSELLLFFCISSVLVSLFLWYSFKSLWGVLVPLTIVVFSLAWMVIIMNLTDKKFDMLTLMLPTIIFVVGMSDLIHFLNRFLDELRQGQSKLQAIKISFKEVGLATFLTSMTTAIGFFSLTIVEIEPVKEFGIYSGIGVLVAYLFTFMMLPLFLIILSPPKNILEGKRKERWESYLTRCFNFIFKKKKVILASFAGVSILSLIAISQLSVNNYLLEDFKESDPVKKDYRFFERNFSGVRPFELELIIGSGSQNICNFKTANEIQKIEKYLESHYTKNGVGFLVSPLDPIRQLYSIKHDNSPNYFKLPKKEKTYRNQLLTVSKLKYITNISLVTSDSTKARISGKIDDVGSLVLRGENKKFNAFIRDSIDSSLITVRLSGTAVLVDKTNEQLSKSILLGLLLAFTIIGLMIGLIYKTWVVVIISMVVNTIPLIMIGGVMYLLNFDIKITTALIFTLAFGIAVDDTIHMLSKLKLLLRNGMPMMDALKKSYLTTGKAIIVTSLILCSGFLSLIFSDFVSMQTMGLLISITLFIAVIVDLTLLPLLLEAFKSKIK
ncbi:MAG: putative RND superfamily exporter protein [Saprospiraceae bacterium]|jgi:predicted RND superfamily exporter protein